MREEILVNVTPREVRAALVESGVVQELFVERASRRGLISNIYKGRVSRVLPGMQAAFVEIGLERTGFLHASDVMPNGTAPEGTEHSVRDLVHEGQEILVQVLKDPLGTKGARLTTFVTLPSRYLVFMPKGQGLGVSARIEDEEERTRLRSVMEDLTDAGTSGGYIVRTAAEGAPRDALRADMLFLGKIWEVISRQAATARPASRVYEDLPLGLRILRDLLGPDIERVRVDSSALCERMQNFAETFVPELAPKIEAYSGERPIFDLYGIEDEIGRALERHEDLTRKKREGVVTEHADQFQ